MLAADDQNITNISHNKLRSFESCCVRRNVKKNFVAPSCKSSGKGENM